MGAGELLVAAGLIVAGITLRSAAVLALGLSLVGIAIATTALWLVLMLMRAESQKAERQNGALERIEDRAARVKAHLDNPT